MKKKILFITSHPRLFYGFGHFFIEKYCERYDIDFVFGGGEVNVSKYMPNTKHTIDITSSNPLTWLKGSLKVKNLIETGNYFAIVQNNHIWAYNKIVNYYARVNNCECWLLNDSTQQKMTFTEHIVLHWRSSQSRKIFIIAPFYFVAKVFISYARTLIDRLLQFIITRNFSIYRYYVDRILYFSDADLGSLIKQGLTFSKEEKIEIRNVNMKEKSCGNSFKIKSVLFIDAVGGYEYKLKKLRVRRLKQILDIYKIVINELNVKFVIRPHPSSLNSFLEFANDFLPSSINIDRGSRSITEKIEEFDLIIGGTSSGLEEAALIYPQGVEKIIISITDLIPYELRSIVRNDNLIILKDVVSFANFIKQLDR